MFNILHSTIVNPQHQTGLPTLPPTNASRSSSTQLSQCSDPTHSDSVSSPSIQLFSVHLSHPLYNKHSPHKPFTSTTIQRQLLAIARNRASLPLFTSRYPSTQPSVFIQQSQTSNSAAIRLQPPITHLQPANTHLHPLNHLPPHHASITILSNPFRNHPHSNALHTHPIPLASIPNALPSHSLSI